MTNAPAPAATLGPPTPGHPVTTRPHTTARRTRTFSWQPQTIIALPGKVPGT